jgi:hypothetical protein
MTDQEQAVHPAIAQFREALRSVDRGDLDPMTTPWSELEGGVARLLGGPFSLENPEHGGVAMLVAAAFGERVRRDLAGFWFQHRDAPGGAAVGFADATMMFSPLEVVVQALARARLAMLDDVTKDLGGSLVRARAEAGLGPAGPRLGPEDYRRLFDPGFVQLACVDLAKTRAALARTAPEEAREIREALGRLPADMPAPVRASLRDQIVGALSALPATGPLTTLAPTAPPLVEIVALLESAVQTTRFAPTELWQHVLLPLLHIGAAETFPPLEDEDREALRAGADPLVVYVETVPFGAPSPDEDGVLGEFPPDEVGVLDPCFADLPTVRAVVVPVASLAPLTAAFDRNAVRAAVERFTKQAVAEVHAGAPTAPNLESKLLPVALELLGELVRVVEAVGEGAPGERVLCVRRAPEAEAASDATIQELRRAVQGSRIILI